MSERFFPDGMPPPMANATTLGWWEEAAEHRLVVQRCTGCSHTRFPPAPICPKCRADDAEWHEVSGQGEVYTYTIMHRPVAAEMTLPFVVAVISLEGSGGLRIISNLVNVEPSDVTIGMPVELVWEDMSADLAIPRFQPTRG
jgi:uncharacterized OB-fold protein